MDDSSQLVTVTSSDHHDALVNGLWDLYSSQRGTDFHIHVDGQSIQAHQLILQVFLSPHKLGVCALKDRPHSLSLDALVQFLYKGSVTVKRGQLQSLLAAANDLDFKLLASAVESASKDSSAGGSRKARRQRKGKPVKRLNGNSDDVQFDDHATPDDSNPVSADDTGSNNAADDWSPPAKKRQTRSKSRTPANVKVKVEKDDEDNVGQTSARKKVVNRQSKRRVKAQPSSPAVLADGDSADSNNAGDGSADPAPLKDTESAPADTRPIIKCKECSYFTRSESRYQLHMARRHDPNANLLPCEKCHKSFKSAALLANHMLLHAKKPAIFTCPICKNYETKTAGNYYHHLRASHEMTTSGEPIPKRHNCTECSYKTTFRFKLRLHREAVHSNIKNFKCEQCDYRAAIKRNLYRHVKVAHLKIRPYICEICASTFTTLSHLAKHHKMHTGEKPYVCSVDTCRKAYASQYAFKAHVRRHEGFDDKVFVCDVCGFACNRKDNLRVHLRNVHDRRQENL